MHVVAYALKVFRYAEQILYPGFLVRLEHLVEDDIYGKCMKENHIEIEHIDNPIGFSKYESNEEFLRKTEEGLRTLLTFSDELTDYSTIITVSNQLKRWKLSPVMRVFHQMFHRLEYRNLCGKYPSLFLFKLYKLGYYMMLQH